MFKIKLSQNEPFKKYIDLIIDRQLLDEKLWEKCVNVFSSCIDNCDDGWRGEYWGKMMRGACLIYSVAPSPQLMKVLTGAVKGLLSKQEESGRISSYSEDNEFIGWDMWSRKYVITGLQHFYDICTDDELKRRIVTALKRHADYIVERIGEGKKEILQTGTFWGGVNSASILEPFVRLYKDTGEKRYLDFAEYIIKTGGCRDGNLIDFALNGTPPYLFPEQKAYETMSFFEGLLAYYEVTGNRKYLDAVLKFTDSMLKTDVTVIGSCGCTHELFDNSAKMQTEYTGKIMQETCVTVTLIRLLSRLYNVTGDKKLTDTIRLASVNALAGALNIQGYKQFSNEKKEYLDGLLFDSYSPLCDSQRALGIGGFKHFADGSYFGCCACIASAGFALYPLMSAYEDGRTVKLNYLVNAEYKFDNGLEIKVDDNEITVINIDGGDYTIIVANSTDSLKITAAADDKAVSTVNESTAVSGKFKAGDTIELTKQSKLIETKLNGKSSFAYGGFTLAADTAKSDIYTPQSTLSFKRNGDDIIFTVLEAKNGEKVRIGVETDKGTLVLTDYSSAGQDGKSTITAWF